MHIGVAQTSPTFGRVEQNLADAIDLISREHADVWVLPELFSTGYQFLSAREAREHAEPIPGGPTTRALARHAVNRQCAVVAGLAENDGSKTYNAAVLVTPAGATAVYRKIHLFYKEKEQFFPGDRRFAVHSVGPLHLAMMICFDHLFPESARSLALLGADIIAHPANLVLPDLAQRTMAVRALENGVYTATANRVGMECRGGESLQFTGQSQIVSPDGSVLTQLPPDAVDVAVVEIDLSAARDKQITPHNDKLGDRRPEMYVDRACRPQHYASMKEEE
jgi:5-aminopentanamidase